MNGLSLRFELFTDDPQRSVTFYTRILGFEVIRHSEKYDSLKRGSVIIGIGSAHKLIDNHYFRPEVITDRKGLGVEIVLEVDDVQLEYDNVRKTGYPIYEELVRRKHNLTDFRIVDPDGYYLRITSRD